MPFLLYGSTKNYLLCENHYKSLTFWYCSLTDDDGLCNNETLISISMQARCDCNWIKNKKNSRTLGEVSNKDPNRIPGRFFLIQSIKDEFRIVKIVTNQPITYLLISVALMFLHRRFFEWDKIYINFTVCFFIMLVLKFCRFLFIFLLL